VSDKEPWFPRPLIQELDMRMPLLNMDNQHGKLEERYEGFQPLPNDSC
jgi:chromosome transmission fidelity protein 4